VFQPGPAYKNQKAFDQIDESFDWTGLPARPAKFVATELHEYVQIFLTEVNFPPSQWGAVHSL